MGGIEQDERRWGGPDYQWFGSLLPRVRQFLPADTILEIGPGHGRWTRYLLRHCDRMIGVDLSAEHVDVCRKRFADAPGASFHENDGLSLDAAPDGEVDFAFSFDSLVHAERDVLESYVHQLARKLRPDGVGFIHHSNVGEYRDPETGELPFTNTGRRGTSMSARLFEQYCGEAGLCCIAQELVNWDTDDALNDCLSTLTCRGSRFERENRVLEHDGFMVEAAHLGDVAAFYGPRGFGG